MSILRLVKGFMSLLQPSFGGGGSGGGGGDQRVTTINEPWGPQQDPLKRIFGEAGNIYDQNPAQMYPGQTYAPLNPLQQLGSQEHLAYGTSPELQNLIGGTQEAYKSMLNAPDVSNNPWVQNLTDVTASRIGDQFQENIMPGITSRAIGAGQLGSSRQGIAEGMAAKSSQQAIADATAGQMSRAYDQGLTQQARGMAFAPQTVGMGFGPASAITSVGDKYRAETEKALREDILRWQFAKESPWEDLGKYQQFVQGNYGGTTNQESSVDSSGFGLGDLAGLGLMGYGLYNSGLFGGGSEGIAPSQAFGAWSGGGGSALGGAASGAAQGYAVGGPYGALAGGIYGGLFS